MNILKLALQSGQVETLSLSDGAGTADGVMGWACVICLKVEMLESVADGRAFRAIYIVDRVS